MISSALFPSAQSASERRTPVNALASGSPNAARMRGAASKLTICSSTFCAKRRTPRASRSSAVQLPGSSAIGSGSVEPVLDAAEPAGEHRREPEIRVARGVRGLELDVRVLRPDRLGARHEAQRGLAIVGAPEGVRAREVPGTQADQGGHARRRHRDHALEVAQDARDERLALGRHALGSVAARQQIAAVLVDRDVEVPAVADAVGRDQRRERRAQPVGACGRADRLAREQLVVGRIERILGIERQLELRPGVLGVDLPDAEPVVVEVGEQLGEELAHVEHRVRAVDGPAVRSDGLVGVLADEPLQLESGLELVAEAARALDQPLERSPVAVLPAGPLLQPELAGSPGEGGLASELDDALGHGLDAEVARRGIEALDAPVDVVLRIEHGEQERDAHAALDCRGELVDGRRTRALNAVAVAPRDGERANALGLQFGSESREIGAHGCSFGRLDGSSERRGYPRGTVCARRRLGGYDRGVGEP